MTRIGERGDSRRAPGLHGDESLALERVPAFVIGPCPFLRI